MIRTFELALISNYAENYVIPLRKVQRDLSVIEIQEKYCAKMEPYRIHTCNAAVKKLKTSVYKITCAFLLSRKSDVKRERDH